MKTSLFAGVTAAFLAVFAAAPGVGATDHAECSHLAMLKLPDVKVTEATAVPAASSGAIRVAHCRVNGAIGSEIHFTLLMPDDWNRKFMMGGGGGFVGQVQNQAAASVNDGYATVGTDTGHQAGITDGKWALDNPERLGQFRPPRGSSDGRGREGDRPQLLRRDRSEVVLLGLLERRPAGVDGGAALSRRLRRHRRGRTGV